LIANMNKPKDAPTQNSAQAAPDKPPVEEKKPDTVEITPEQAKKEKVTITSDAPITDKAGPQATGGVDFTPPTGTGTKKFKLKFGKLAFALADGERGVYAKFKLNEPILTRQELEDEYKETYDDTKELIDNRFNYESKYGDVFNIVLDLVQHFLKRVARFYTSGKRKEGEEGESNGGEEEPPHFNSLAEEAAWYAEKGRKNGNLAPDANNKL